MSSLMDSCSVPPDRCTFVGVQFVIPAMQRKRRPPQVVTDTADKSYPVVSSTCALTAPRCKAGLYSTLACCGRAVRARPAHGRFGVCALSAPERLLVHERHVRLSVNKYCIRSVSPMRNMFPIHDINVNHV
jgi:hypothetical protein